MSEKIRVLVADDHAVVRSGVRGVVNDQLDMTVVGEAGDVGETLRLAGDLVPDVVTLDLRMPGGTGLGAIERLRAAPRPPQVVVLSMHDDPEYVRAAMAVGATGYVSKSAADTALVEAIRAVHRGRVFVDVGPNAPADLPRPGAKATAAARPIDTLSEREREVLIQVARGHTNQAIADRLHLSVKTVESYRSRLMHKLGLTTRAELTAVAMQLGLLDAEPA